MRRRALGAITMVLFAMSVAAGAAPAAGAADPWWQPIGFAGTRVTSVEVIGADEIALYAGGVPYLSADGGRSWRRTPWAAAPADSDTRRWSVMDNRPALMKDHHIASIDRDGPSLVRPDLITSPAAAPDYVVAVDAESVVWRRAADGSWSRSLLLLPAILGAPPPRVTAIASFTDRPLSDAMYLATDGFGVLVTQNGGDDWIRFDPGLPAHVTGLATDSSRSTVYAATDSGLYAHRLQLQPSIPAYRDAAYWWRLGGMALVVVAASGAGISVLRRLLRDPRPGRPPAAAGDRP